LALQLFVTFRGLMRFRVTRRQLIRIQLPISTAAGRGVWEGSPVCFAVQEAGSGPLLPRAYATTYLQLVKADAASVLVDPPKLALDPHPPDGATAYSAMASGAAQPNRWLVPRSGIGADSEVDRNPVQNMHIRRPLVSVSLPKHG
jgi:hypothetical protein